MATTVQEFRERRFNAKESERRRSALEPFLQKLAHIQPPADSTSPARLSLAVLRVISVMTEAEKEGVIALKLAAGRNKDLLHIQIILDAPRRPIDFSRLEQILKAHELLKKWEKFRSAFSSGS